MTMDDKTHPSVLDNTELWWVQMMARAKPEISTATAQAAMTTWLDQDARATMKAEKDTVNPSVAVLDGSQGIGETNHDFSMQLYVLSTLTGLVLLLACANLANLLLARSASRQREMAVRLALGASRGRVLRQVLTESLLLSSLGGAAGLALGYAGRNVIPHMYTAPWQAGPLRADFDLTICAFAVGISILTGVLFGVIPAWQATRTSVNTGLKDAAASTTRRRKGMTGRGLVIIQIALSMLLVVGAGLFAATLRNLHQESLGFDPQNLLLFSVHAPAARYPAPKDVQLYERIEERLQRVPGVSGVTLTREPVLGGGGTNLPFIPTGQPKRNGNDEVVWVQDVGRSFFDVYRIPLLYGRKFSLADTSTSQPLVMVNQALVERFWPHESPIGKTVKMDRKQSRSFEVAGIVADAKYARLGDKAPPTAYRLYDQMDQEVDMTYVIKTPLPLNDVLPQIREAVAEVDRDLPVRDVRTQTEQIAATVSEQRTFAVLTGAFGVLALVLACIGIYGLMAYDVARRTNEIGIRMALGAQATQMQRLVLGEASWLALVGIATGLCAALLLTRYVKSMLYGLTPTDPWILTGAAILLLAVALLAGFGPAQRASRVEPMEALRHE
jgi:predicted permease